MIMEPHATNQARYAEFQHLQGFSPQIIAIVGALRRAVSRNITV
jgi:hypothetical protein